jgi:hypothetical protein
MPASGQVFIQMGQRTIRLMLVLDLQLATYNKRTFQVDVADVGDYEPPTAVSAIHDGIVQDEGREFVLGCDWLQDGQLGDVFDIAQVDRGDGRIGETPWTSKTAPVSTRASGAPRSAWRPSRSAPSHY